MRSARRGLMLIAQVVGLFATGWIVWSVAVLPRLSQQPLAQIVLSAFLHTLFACAAAVTITLLLYLAIARSIASGDSSHRLIASGHCGRVGASGECHTVAP